MNGEVVTELGRRVDPAIDLVAVDGTAVQLDPGKRYVMLEQAHRRRELDEGRAGPPRPAASSPTDYEERLFNVGRLDAETSGLLLLTNDGELAHVLAHPSFGVTKTYIAKVRGRVDAADHRARSSRGSSSRTARSPPTRRGSSASRPRSGSARRAHPALGTQPHRAPHAGRRRASGRSSSCGGSSGRCTWEPSASGARAT